MQKIQQLIDKYKVQIMPWGAEDWEIICREVAKEYALEIVNEIMNNYDYFEMHSDGWQSYMDKPNMEAITKLINGE